MKTFLRVFLLSLLFIMSIGFANASTDASDATYIVKQGDNLTKIARAHNTTWRALQKINAIKNANIIRPNEVIKLREANVITTSTTATVATVTTVQPKTLHAEKSDKPFLWKNPGAAKCKKCAMESSVKKLGYPTDIANELIAKVKNRDFTVIEITRGMHLDGMLFGKQKLKKNIIVSWNSGHTERAHEYVIIYDGTRYALIYPLTCGNWSKSIKTVSPPIAIGPTQLVPLHTPVKEKLLQENIPAPIPTPISEKISTHHCDTCGEFIVLLHFEPRGTKHEYWKPW